MRFVTKIILVLALITPVMPKLKLMDDVTMYPLEILLLIFFPFLINKIRLKIQIVLFLMWFIMLGATLVSFIESIDIGGLFRCIKGIIYIPLVYLAYQECKKREFNFKIVIYIYFWATVNNILFMLFYGINLLQINIWNPETIGSGMSNRFFDLSTFSFGTQIGGAHGIWGNYCVLVFALAIFMKLKNKISYKLFILVIICLMINMGMSVSREALISFVMVLFALCFLKDEGNWRKINKTAWTWILSFSVLFVIVIILWGDSLPIVKKVIYTQNSLSSTGTEGNLQLRINGWMMYFESLMRNPIKIFTGYGYNLSLYSQYLNSIRLEFGSYYVAIPESFFIQIFCFGGITCLLFGSLFWLEIIMTCRRLKKEFTNLKTILTFFFIGMLIGNIFSGASILSDVLYCQILLLIGYLNTIKNEKSIINNSSQ